jgi:hypothetical protein
MQSASGQPPPPLKPQQDAEEKMAFLLTWLGRWETACAGLDDGDLVEVWLGFGGQESDTHQIVPEVLNKGGLPIHETSRFNIIEKKQKVMTQATNEDGDVLNKEDQPIHGTDQFSEKEQKEMDKETKEDGDDGSTSSSCGSSHSPRTIGDESDEEMAQYVQFFARQKKRMDVEQRLQKWIEALPWKKALFGTVP